MLTGRRGRFDTLRQLGGISGFLVRTESDHDQFGAGHAGTSISAAHGMALARDLKKEDFNVVAVIGDGALTAGMAFEGLNNVGHDHRRAIGAPHHHRYRRPAYHGSCWRPALAARP